MICTGKERCILRAKSGSKDSKLEILIRKKRFGENPTQTREELFAEKASGIYPTIEQSRT